MTHAQLIALIAVGSHLLLSSLCAQEAALQEPYCLFLGIRMEQHVLIG